MASARPVSLLPALVIATFSVLSFANTASAARPVVLDITAPDAFDQSALGNAISERLRMTIIAPSHRRARRARGVLSIIVTHQDGGHRAAISFRPRRGQDRALMIVVHATGANDNLWIADAAAAAVRTVERWNRRQAPHREVLDPWLEGHRANSLSDPYEGEDRPEPTGVQVDSLFVGQDIINPWEEAVRAAENQR